MTYTEKQKLNTLLDLLNQRKQYYKNIADKHKEKEEYTLFLVYYEKYYTIENVISEVNIIFNNKKDG